MTKQDALHPLQLRINGENYQLNVPANRTLVDVLRHDIGLTGTKETCSVGVCGACTVLVDGEMIASCITLAVTVFNAEITTIEGLDKDGPLHPVQESFINNGGFQCGACTSGQVLAAKSLLDHNPTPSEIEIKEWMMGNLCRCTGYYQIIESVVKAVASTRHHDNPNA
ncbi:MAG: (2Fe-2S)-binding protein [SAR202 cluster bacterium]|nr:(2Fe-2S)-binding protein [SAR202 cluster bacterium]|tara:strand:+ start:409 stop:912 length:504 start_codon:yes stop_codon:yes gene_type:complete